MYGIHLNSKRIPLVSAVASATLALAALWPASAMAAGSDAVTTTTNSSGAVTVTGPDFTAGWAPVAYAKSHPSSPAGQALTASLTTWASSSSAESDAFSGLAQPNSTGTQCNSDALFVCINVQGSKLHVDSWTAQVYGNVGCSTREFCCSHRHSMVLRVSRMTRQSSLSITEVNRV